MEPLSRNEKLVETRAREYYPKGTLKLGAILSGSPHKYFYMFYPDQLADKDDYLAGSGPEKEVALFNLAFNLGYSFKGHKHNIFNIGHSERTDIATDAD